MMWDQVILRIAALLRSDDTLVGIFGSSMQMAGTSPLRVPMLEWTLIADGESELWAPCVIQFDQWHTEAAMIVQSERRLRSLLHVPRAIVLDGLYLSGQYQDGSVLASPDRNGFDGRAARFLFLPLRARYALPVLTHTP